MNTNDESKLPKWAQRALDRLRRDLASAEARLAEGPEDSTVFADVYASVSRPLGTDPTIRFQLGQDGNAGQYIDVARRDPDGSSLRIMAGTGSISVQPQSSNVIVVKALR